MGEPLCTYERYAEFKSMGDDLNEDRCIQNVKKTMDKLPYRNRETFYALLNFLGHVMIFEEDNKMNAKNLAVVFAPNLFKPFEMT